MAHHSIWAAQASVVPVVTVAAVVVAAAEVAQADRMAQQAMRVA